MGLPLVCMSVRRRVVLAPIHLCSLLNMFAPSRSQPFLYTEKISAIETTSITVTILTHLHPYQYLHQHLSVFVVLFMHLCMNLLSVHVAPIPVSILDIPATAFQLHDTYAYKDHTHINTWRCTYRYILHIITLSSSLSIRALSICFNLLQCSVCVCLLVICMIWFLCCIVSLFHIPIVSNITQVLSSKLASFLSISTIHHSFSLTVLALLLVSILDFIAALSKKQLVDRRKPHISCLHSIILSCDNVLQPCVWMRG
jgi:hypothetical protein